MFMKRFLPALLVACLLSPAAMTFAKKGGGGNGGGGGGGGEEPTPVPGMIYFSGAVDGQVSTYELDPDGASITHLTELDVLGDSTGLDFASPFGTGYPSTLTYGADGHRWWIYFRLIRTENPTPNSTRYFYDLFATPDGVNEIRITNFSDDNIVVGLNSKPPFWATGNDGFISFMGADVNDHLHKLYRIWISGDDLEAEYNGTDTGLFPVLSTDIVLTEIVTDAPTLSGANFRNIAWSPDGNQVVFSMDDGISEAQESLWRLDLLESSEPELIFVDSSASPHVRWSPDGSMIAIADLGDILVMDPNVPGSEVVVVDGSIGTPYTHPLWAPDGSHIACQQQSTKRVKGDLQTQYKIYSVSLSDFSIQEIGKNADPLSYKRLLEWTPE